MANNDMDTVARLFGLVGHPLGHSFSCKYFTEKFEEDGIDARYVNFDIDDISRLREIVAAHPNLRGLNVTIPYKQAVIPMLDKISPLAQSIGAVNVIVVTRDSDGKPILEGYNTDCLGFGRSIDVFAIAHPLESDSYTSGDDGDFVSALVLGTGGASHAVSSALKMRGIEPTLVSRTPGPGKITYDDLTEAVMRMHRLVINTTPLGTYPVVDECAPIPYELLTPRHICMDLVYNPGMTKFMRKGAAQGCAVKNGLHMLYAQADLSWRLWMGEQI